MDGEILLEDTPGGGTHHGRQLPKAAGHDARPRRRRRAADPARRSASTCGRAATRSMPPRRAKRRSSSRPRHHPDVVVLDLGLPGIDGIEVIRGLRGWTQVPIIVLSVRDAEAAKVAALDAGADDYVTKPFGMDELLARLRAALRRSAPADEEAARRRHARLHDRPRREARAPATARGAAHADRVAPRRGARAQPGEARDPAAAAAGGVGPRVRRARRNYLRVFMAQVRRKLEPEPAQPRYFITEPGMGYRFEPPPEHVARCERRATPRDRGAGARARPLRRRRRRVPPACGRRRSRTRWITIGITESTSTTAITYLSLPATTCRPCTRGG